MPDIEENKTVDIDTSGPGAEINVTEEKDEAVVETGSKEQETVTKENNEETFYRLENLEKKLKEIFDQENEENRKIISEKNEKIEELQLYIKNLEDNLHKFKLQFENLSNKAYDISVSEIKKRDEVINYISEEYEKKLNSFNEEQKIISSLFHKVSYEYITEIFEKNKN